MLQLAGQDCLAETCFECPTREELFTLGTENWDLTVPQTQDQVFKLQWLLRPKVLELWVSSPNQMLFTGAAAGLQGALGAQFMVFHNTPCSRPQLPAKAVPYHNITYVIRYLPTPEGESTLSLTSSCEDYNLALNATHAHTVEGMKCVRQFLVNHAQLHVPKLRFLTKRTLAASKASQNQPDPN